MSYKIFCRNKADVDSAATTLERIGYSKESVEKLREANPTSDLWVMVVANEDDQKKTAEWRYIRWGDAIRSKNGEVLAIEGFIE